MTIGPFEKGDRVQVVMTRCVFPWQAGAPDPLRFEAIFLYGPEGADATFGLDVDGRRLELNGNASEFVGIYREEV